MHHRELLGPLCAAAWQTVRELMAVAAGEEQGFRPGMVAMSQTFGDQLNPHPHVHALVTRGGWTGSGEWVGVPYVSSSAAEQLFRHKVIRLLQRAGLLDDDRTRLLLSTSSPVSSPTSLTREGTWSITTAPIRTSCAGN